jgi:3-deoxy-D-manno-octulosonate 8-phosphate phosphatase (KDO 8-P phosphatase)
MAKPSASQLKRARNIRLVAMDVDGVMTAGDVIVLKSGEEVKLWNAKDRLVIATLRDLKVPLTLAWITGRSSDTVTKTAANLGIKHVLQQCHRKGEALAKLVKDHGWTMEQAAFIGDDILDLPALLTAGFSACPSDAVPDVRKRVHYVSPCGGGKGAVRDVLEFILRAQNKWDDIVSTFLP